MIHRLAYDGLGRLIYRQAPLEPGPNPILQTEHYYYDGVRRIQEVTDRPAVGQNPAATWTEREYVYGPDYVDEYILQVDDPYTDPAEDEKQIIYMLQDANYNVVALLDTDGNVLAQYTYEPYGTRVFADEYFDHDSDQNPDLQEDQVVGHQGLFFYRLNFGQSSLHPDTTGLYYNRNRWYNPQLGRFMQRDPNETGIILSALIMNGKSSVSLLGAFDPESHFGNGMNLYQYCLGNSITNIDPMGLMTGRVEELVVAPTFGAWLYTSAASSGGAAMVFVSKVIGMAYTYSFTTSVATITMGATVAGSVDPSLWPAIYDEFVYFSEHLQNMGPEFQNSFNNWLNNTGGTGIPGGPDWWGRFQHTFKHAAEWFGKGSPQQLSQSEIEEWGRLISRALNTRSVSWSYRTHEGLQDGLAYLLKVGDRYLYVVTTRSGELVQASKASANQLQRLKDLGL
ncbi:MAG: RHS repeat-associated core domain-containing protein [Planctomycetota bacterium]|jgi:RHS repeat-associated protein